MQTIIIMIILYKRAEQLPAVLWVWFYELLAVT